VGSGDEYKLPTEFITKLQGLGIHKIAHAMDPNVSFIGDIYRLYRDILQVIPQADNIGNNHHNNFSNYGKSMEIIALSASVSLYNQILGLLTLILQM
jgi:hypothetical protein